ncbi:hypothetical protein [Constantimarinum furrinae]|uniref:Adhesin domain-containing protein n=1 Tax=Constantimarinum furrinae TaxID=2562285 RepID=A0A7G8PSR1_9FLAO|nr:hypothetical protein [Constantimarinum furrinae]QNJ97377.1 hypothetical protein ALE3EI_0802 [Constantimarinum furrinae]
MLKRLVAIAIMLPCLAGFGQKLSTKEFDAEAIHRVEIEADNVFKVTVESSKSKKISLVTAIEGETFENILVTSVNTYGVLKIGTAFTPFYVPRNDKLTAHKVISAEMTLTVPEGITVVVESNLATVYGSGNFQRFDVSLASGSCFLSDFTGNAKLHTKQGTILVSAGNGVSGKAISRYGMAINELPKRKKYLIEAESLYGTVKLLRTQ